VTVKVEFFELSKSTEAEQAEDLLAQVVAEVAVAPDLLEGAAVLGAGGRRGVLPSLLGIAWVERISISIVSS
jgi:hypothetical protein